MSQQNNVSCCQPQGAAMQCICVPANVQICICTGSAQSCGQPEAQTNNSCCPGAVDEKS